MDFLFNAGTGWSGTTPFYYTLAQDQKYIHTGYSKEMCYLKLMTKPEERKQSYIRYKYDTSLPGFPWIDAVDNRQFIDPKETMRFLQAPLSVKNYVEYYLRLAKKVKGTYHAVGDFSNSTFYLDEEFLLEVYRELRKHFNVKVTFQFRDPIYRYFSRVGKYGHHFSMWSQGEKNILERSKKRKKFDHIGTYKRLLMEEPIHEGALYVDGIKKFRRVFGRDNVLPVVMEEFFRGEQDISKFLEYPITKIHENVFVPERGTKAPKLDGLMDQWSSDQDDISPELYEWSKQYLDFVYDDWKDYFGSLPIYWHSHSSGI